MTSNEPPLATCPGCRAANTTTNAWCDRCGIGLVGQPARDIHAVDTALADLGQRLSELTATRDNHLRRRGELLHLLHNQGEAARTAAVLANQRTESPPAHPASVGPDQLSSAPPIPRQLTRSTDNTPSEPEPNSPQPNSPEPNSPRQRAGRRGPMPQARPNEPTHSSATRTEAAAVNENSPWTVQNVLLALGGVLLSVAAIVFTVFAWGRFGVTGRAVIMATLTAAMFVAPVPLKRFGLAATGRTIGTIALVFLGLDWYAAWAVGLIPHALPASTYAGVAFAGTAAVAAVYPRLIPNSFMRPVAVMLAQPVLPLMAVATEPNQIGWAATAAVLAAGNLAFLTTIRNRTAAVPTGDDTASEDTAGAGTAGTDTAGIDTTGADAAIRWSPSTIASAVSGGVVLLIGGCVAADAAIQSVHPVPTAAASAVLVALAAIVAAAGVVLPSYRLRHIGAACLAVTTTLGVTLLSVRILLPALSAAGIAEITDLAHVSSLIGATAALALAFAAPAISIRWRMGMTIGAAIVATIAAIPGVLYGVRAALALLPLWSPYDYLADNTTYASLSGPAEFVVGLGLPVGTVMSAIAIAILIGRTTGNRANAQLITVLGATVATVTAPLAAPLPWPVLMAGQFAVAALLFTLATLATLPALPALGRNRATDSPSPRVRYGAVIGGFVIVAFVIRWALLARIPCIVAFSTVAVGAIVAAWLVRRHRLGWLPVATAIAATGADILAIGGPVALNPTGITLACLALTAAGCAFSAATRTRWIRQSLAAEISVLPGPFIAYGVIHYVGFWHGIDTSSTADVLLRLGLVCCATGLLAGAVALRSDRRWLVSVAIALELVASWHWLAAASVRTPEAYTLPASLTVLACAILLARWGRIVTFAHGDLVLIGIAGAVGPSLVWSAVEPEFAWIRLTALAVVTTAVAIATARKRPRILGIDPTGRDRIGVGATASAVLLWAGTTAAVGAHLMLTWHPGPRLLQLDLPVLAYGPLAVAATAAALAGLLRPRPGRPSALAERRSRALEYAAVPVGAAALLVGMTSQFHGRWILLLAGLVVGAVALDSRRHTVAYVAIALELVASWYWLAGAAVQTPEAYTMPTALLALGAGWLATRRWPGTISWVTMAPGLLALLLPSLAYSFAEPDVAWRRFVIGALALAITLAGAAQRRQAPFLIGAGTLAVVAVHELAPAVANVANLVPAWVPIAAGGLLLIVIGASYERRRRDLIRLTRAIAAMR